MKKHVFLSLFASLFLCQLAAADAGANVDLHANTSEIEMVQDAGQQIEALIAATKDALARLQRLQVLIKEFKDTEQMCIKYPNDTKLLYLLAHQGHDAYEVIQEANLHDFFRPEFVAELKKLHAIGDKKTIPPAK